MGYRKQRLTARKNSERDRLKLGILKSQKGRPCKKKTAAVKHQNRAPPSLSQVHSKIILPSNKWADQTTDNSFEIRLCKLGDHTVSSETGAAVILTLKISSDCKWSLLANEINVASDCKAISNLPRSVDLESVNEVLKHLDGLSICPGNPDEHFMEMAKAKRVFKSKKGNISASVDTCSDVFLRGKSYNATVRVSSCHMLVPSGRCSACISYRSILRKIYLRWKACKQTTPTRHISSRSRTNFRYLTSPLKRRRLEFMRARIISTERKMEKLKRKIETAAVNSGIALDADLHQDLSQIMQDHTPAIHEQFPVGSFKRLFWEQQREALNADSRQMRWHPTMIKWCLNIKLHSTAAYEALRDSGFMCLPSSRTLRDYTHYMESNTGFQAEVTEELMKEAKFDTLEPFQKHVALVFDEVRIKNSLVFDKHGLKVIGFVDIGNINNELMKFEQSLEDSELKRFEQRVAKYMLVFMVRGIFINLKFPYVQFATRNLTSDLLFPLVWETIQKLEAAGFMVTSVTCDGASQNRKFFHMHGNDSQVYKTVNPYADPPRYVYFFSDVPHLIKTTRNCWANSFSHSHTRALWINGSHISWGHLSSLYNKSSTKAGLSLIPKIKLEHIKLSSYSKMKVYLATQVLSSSVCKGLNYFNDPETTETQRFCQMFDRFFDCLNGRSYTEGRKKRKPDLLPYRTSNDTRLKWLKESFLGYLEEWKSCVANRPDFTDAEKQKMMLSRETTEGLFISVNSFVEVCKYLLSLPGAKAVFSEHFNQDPLESFFGKQRTHGGYNDNPTVRDFVYNTTSLRLQGSLAKDPVRGNCRRRQRSEDVIDDTPLPKRKRK